MKPYKLMTSRLRDRINNANCRDKVMGSGLFAKRFPDRPLPSLNISVIQCTPGFTYWGMSGSTNSDQSNITSNNAGGVTEPPRHSYNCVELPPIT